MASTRELQKQQDQQLRRAADARDKGFDGTADKALAAAAEIGRQIEAQDAPGPWRAAAHP